MAGYNGVYVFGAAVAEFYRVFIEQFSEFMFFGKVLLYEVQEFSTNVRFYLGVVWGIELDNLSGSISSFLTWSLERQVRGKPASR